MIRAIGAKSSTVLLVVLLEVFIIALTGILLGAALAYMILAVASNLVSSQLGLTLPFMTLELNDALKALSLLPVTVLFALIPAFAASNRSPLERLR